MNLSSVLKSKRQDIIQIASAHGVGNVRVFGSVARGQARQGSDLDLLVQLEKGYSLLDLIAIKQDLEDLLGCSVDVVIEAALSPYIRERVLQEATRLYE